MFALNDNEMAMLELLVMKPLSDVPPNPDMLAGSAKLMGWTAPAPAHLECAKG